MFTELAKALFLEQDKVDISVFQAPYVLQSMLRVLRETRAKKTAFKDLKHEGEGGEL